MKGAHPLGQYMTPDWAAVELVDRYFGDLTLCDQVLEPSCGKGAFLRAIPDHVPAYGVELDPALADQARETSGRVVIQGDFLTVDVPRHPTVIIGNPPYKLGIIQPFLDRAWQLLPTDGRVGFILPCYAFQTASTFESIRARWSIRQDMIPRNIFQRLSIPICFAVLTKDRAGRLQGFTLYPEVHAVSRLQKRYRALLASGQRSVWAALTTAALEALGGVADLAAIYREVEGHRPTTNSFWQAKVRQTVQRIAVRVGPGRWALPQQQGQAA